MSTPHQRYLRNRFDAYHRARRNLRDRLACDFMVAEISSRAFQAIADQWDGNGRNLEASWNWRELMRRYRDPDRIDFAIWCNPERISGLGLAITTSNAVELKFLEADPRADCPLRGKRALIALETVACYAQVRGKRELRVRPVDDAVASLYRDIYGFETAMTSKAASYLVKRV